MTRRRMKMTTNKRLNPSLSPYLFGIKKVLYRSSFLALLISWHQSWVFKRKKNKWATMDCVILISSIKWSTISALVIAECVRRQENTKTPPATLDSTISMIYSFWKLKKRKVKKTKSATQMRMPCPAASVAPPDITASSEFVLLLLLFVMRVFLSSRQCLQYIIIFVILNLYYEINL